jgi:hypothetical protein
MSGFNIQEGNESYSYYLACTTEVSTAKKELNSPLIARPILQPSKLMVKSVNLNAHA